MSPNPPASSAGVMSRGSSSRASGFPCVSATTRLITFSSTHRGKTDASTARASASDRPSRRNSVNPVTSVSSAGSRPANSSATASASSRRATNPSARADARSSHCTSSTTHSSGRAEAAPDSRLSTPRPTKNGSGGTPALSPNAVSSATRWGSGSCRKPLSSGTHNWCRPANASSISDSTPDARAT